MKEVCTSGFYHRNLQEDRARCVSGSIDSNNAFGGGAIFTPYGNLSNVNVNSGFRFWGNVADRAVYAITPQEHALHAAHVKATDFTEPFRNAYNNFDIAFPVPETAVVVHARKLAGNVELLDGQFSFGLSSAVPKAEATGRQ